MLSDFFSLNGTTQDLVTEQDLLDQLQISGHLQNLLYRPTAFAPERPSNRIFNKKFENFSFAKTTITGVEFRRCTFKDCLLIGTRFIDCEFYDCRFDGVNTHKIKFAGTYINPEVFGKVLDRQKHANIGVHLFQQLLANALSTHQPGFAQSAEYHFRRWQRYYLNYERRSNQVSRIKWLIRWLPNVLYHCFAGYGLRTRFFAFWTALLIILIPLFNYRYWDLLAIRSRDGMVEYPSGIETFYFSVVTIATVGFGDFVPTSQFGMLMVGLEALVGVVWISLFASTLIKRLVR